MESMDVQRTYVETIQDEQIIGNSPDAKRLRRAVKRLSKIDSNILIVGETGTGKEFLARQIFAASSRKSRSFVEINCSAIGKTIEKRDIYGEDTEKDEAVMRTIGLLEKANKGVLLLDNISEMDNSFQFDLLQILNDKRFRRIGGRENIPLDVRIISTTDKDLTPDLDSDAFRKDLYYHLNTLTIHIPPLRERKQDIPELFIYFLKKFCMEINKDIPAVPSDIFESILTYEWRGNVRELENTVQNLVMMSPEGELSPDFLPFKIKRHRLDFMEPKNLKGWVSEVETYLIEKALNKFGGNQVKAARLLGIPEATLRFKMKKYDIPKD
ncbi:sigma-54-dependent Fis family transcriptional regulator [candidate division KSB1 bacterium]|nr:sigma-54-dependent Fis family transcriptional regulator [candidate division KSB1 bacterium]